MKVTFKHVCVLIGHGRIKIFLVVLFFMATTIKSVQFLQGCFGYFLLGNNLALMQIINIY
jgi:hypothetical protein